MSRLTRQLLKAVAEAFDTPRIEPSRGYQIRASALPFCGRAYALATELQRRDQLGDHETDFGLQCIFETGHGAHAVSQEWLGRSKLLWGDWRCHGPARPPPDPVSRQHEHILRQYLAANVCGEPAPRGYLPDHRCPRCGSQRWTYVEVTLSDEKLGISAHTDGVFPEFRATVELKTTYEKKHTKLTAPLIKHWTYQASMYANLLEEQEGLRIDHILMVYFDRTRFNRKFFVRPVMKDVLPSTRAMVKQAKQQVRLKVLPTRICASRSMAKALDCSLEHECFSPAIHRILGWTPP